MLSIQGTRSVASSRYVFARRVDFALPVFFLGVAVFRAAVFLDVVFRGLAFLAELFRAAVFRDFFPGFDFARFVAFFAADFFRGVLRVERAAAFG
jgi:hypothetical protein